MIKNTPRTLQLGLFLTCFLAANMMVTRAAVITQTGVSGENSGGQPVFEISELKLGDSFDLTWAYTDPNASVTVMATGTMTVSQLTTTTLTLDWMLENTTPVQGELTAPITIFGISLDETFTSGTLSDAGDHLDSYDEPNPGFPGFSEVVACATSGQNCAGGDPQSGIPIGDTDSLSFQFTGDFDPNAGVTVDSFAMKFQTPVGSYELPGQPVPEPATLLLFTLAGMMLPRRN